MPAPRSLAEDLRTRSDDELAALVRARPDLIHPVPADVATLAQRAGSAPSVAAALLDLDLVELHVVLAAALGPDSSSAGDLARRVAQPGSSLTLRTHARRAVTRLRERALLWGSDRALHLVGACRDQVVPPDRGPMVAALDPVVAGYARDPASLVQLLAGAPPGVQGAVDLLLPGPVVGTVGNARRQPDPTRSPVDWLFAHHLLLPLGSDRAVLPGEVVALLRAAAAETTPQPLAVPQLDPPAPVAPAPDPTRVEAGAAGAALEVLHAAAEVGLLWGERPPTRLRTGGIAQRDLTAAARATGTSEALLALVVEVALAAGLLAPDTHESTAVLPTTAFDSWLAAPPAHRHADLLLAWRDMPRAVAGPAGRPTATGLAASHLPALRRLVLATLAGSPGAWQDDEVVAAVAWWAPRRAEPTRGEQVRGILRELRALGVLVAGTLTRAGHALLADDRPAAEEALAATLPPQVDALVLQGDLTAVVPGLPSPALATFMRVVADTESRGAASVYRFSPDRIRRALAAGWTPAALQAELARRGTVPQPLAYLIDDLGRQQATLRIGAVSTYLRCDDPVVLAAIVADPAATSLGLVAISDTVLVSALPAEDVLERLHRLGHAPQPEGGMAAAHEGPRRVRSRSAEPAAPQVSAALAAAAVRAMRATDRGSPPASRPPGPGSSGASPGGAHPVPLTGPAEVVAALRAAIATQTPVWIGYADPTGVAGDRRVEPLRIAGGYLTALDLRSEQVQSFALARVTGVQPG